MWSRLAPAGRSDLVVELQTEGGTSLRERLARMLGDPTLELAYRLATAAMSTPPAGRSSCRRAPIAP